MFKEMERDKHDRIKKLYIKYPEINWKAANQPKSDQHKTSEFNIQVELTEGKNGYGGPSLVLHIKATFIKLFIANGSSQPPWPAFGPSHISTSSACELPTHPHVKASLQRPTPAALQSCPIRPSHVITPSSSLPQKPASHNHS